MNASFDFDFRNRTLEGDLGRLVESVWYARGTIPYTREKIAPTGSSVAVIVLGDPILQTPNNGRGETLRAENGFLIGPHDQPVINEPTGETYAVGIVTTPIGCEGVFKLRPSRIRGRVVDLESAWPAEQRLRKALVKGAGDPEGMLDLVVSELEADCDVNLPGLGRCERAVGALVDDPVRPIADIASEFGISHAHLDREFARIVGLTPRALARLLRMRKLLAGIDVDLSVDWADLAYELGWFDQAHLIRDFKRHTGVTPTQYIAAQRAVYSPVEAADAAGFVPEAE